MEYAEHLVQIDGVIRRYSAIYTYAKISIIIGYIVLALTVMGAVGMITLMAAGAGDAYEQEVSAAIHSPGARLNTEPDSDNAKDAAGNTVGVIIIFAIYIIVGMIPGLIAGFLCIVAGQVMRAFADLAVHTSPFLSPVNQAVAMGLR
jgi:hypothetical protein